MYLLNKVFRKKKFNKFKELEGLENCPISEPENIEMGVKIEVDSEKGQLKNVPENMKEFLGEGKAQYVKTDGIDSHLQIEIKDYKKKEEISNIITIGQPSQFEQKIKITYDEKNNTFIGLPKDMLETLVSQIKPEELQKNPDLVLRALMYTVLGPDFKKEEKSLGKLSNYIIQEDPNTVFGKFHQIDEGMFGTVYRAKHLKTNKVCAIKVIKISQDSKNLENLAREIEMMSFCQHKNIVQYIGTYMKGEELWIVMELMEGGKLTDIIFNTKFTEPEIAFIMKETLEGLYVLHDNNLIHRDIKSDNILVNKQGELKLADFGFCCKLKDEKEKRISVLGTPYWMSPEVIKGEPYSFATDIWSLGIVAIELCEQEPPHMDKQPVRALLYIAKSNSPTLKNSEKYSNEFKDFLQCCLEVDQNKRSTAAELLRHPFLKKSEETKAEFLVKYMKKFKLI